MLFQSFCCHSLWFNQTPMAKKTKASKISKKQKMCPLAWYWAWFCYGGLRGGPTDRNTYPCREIFTGAVLGNVWPLQALSQMDNLLSHIFGVVSASVRFLLHRSHMSLTLAQRHGCHLKGKKFWPFNELMNIIPQRIVNVEEKWSKIGCLWNMIQSYMLASEKIHQ